ELFRKGCEAGHGRSCSSLAYEGRYSTARKDAEAIALLRKGCDLASYSACDSLAVELLATGDAAGAQKARESFFTLGKADCERGCSGACAEVPDCLKDDLCGTPANPLAAARYEKQARTLAVKACGQGFLDECSREAATYWQPVAGVEMDEARAA